MVLFSHYLNGLALLSDQILLVLEGCFLTQQ